MTEIMTDYQFKTILKMVHSILEKAKDIEEAKQEVENLINEKDN